MTSRRIAALMAIAMVSILAATGCQSESSQALIEERARLETTIIDQERVINEMRLQVNEAQRQTNVAISQKSMSEQSAAEQVATARRQLELYVAQTPAPNSTIMVSGTLSAKIQQQLDSLVRRYPGARIVGNRLVLSSDIYFASGSTALSPSAQGMLRELTPILRSEQLTLLIVGHTDSDPVRNPALKSRGITDNRMLSMVRAKNVMDEMKKYGYPDNMIYATGWGELMPITMGNTKEDKAVNRRVEIIIDAAASQIHGFSQIDTITAMK